MEFVVNKRELVRALGRVQSVADKKSAIPSLTHALVVADASGLRLSATDLTLSIATTCRADVRKGGAVALPARHFGDFVKVLPDGDVTVTVEKNFSAQIKSGKHRFRLSGLPAEDFPTMPDPSKVAFTLVPADDLSELIALVSFSLSTDETRPHLCAALFEFSGDTLRVVTTDGHRLSKAERTIPGMKGQSKLLLPAKAVHELKRMADELRAEKKESSAGPLTIGVGASKKDGPVFFQREGVTLSTKLVDAAFPSYAQVIPESCDRTLTVARVPLLAALQAVALVHESVGLDAGAGRLVVTGEREGDDVSIELEGALLGPDLSMIVSTAFLSQVMAALSSEEVAIECTGALDPMAVRPVGRGDSLHVLMPKRTR